MYAAWVAVVATQASVATKAGGKAFQATIVSLCKQSHCQVEVQTINLTICRMGSRSVCVLRSTLLVTAWILLSCFPGRSFHFAPLMLMLRCFLYNAVLSEGHSFTTTHFCLSCHIVAHVSHIPIVDLCTALNLPNYYRKCGKLRNKRLLHTT